MQNPTLSLSMNKQKVNLLAEPNFLAFSILENLLSKNCYIRIFSNNIKEWKANTKHLNNQNISISSLRQVSSEDTDYIIFCTGFISSKKTFDDLIFFNKKIDVSNSKVIAIFPYESYYLNTPIKPFPNANTLIVYVGDLFGPRMDLRSDLTSSRLIGEVLTKRSLSLGVGESIFPVFVSDAAKIISKWMFSFGPYGKQVFLLGPQISATDYWKENEHIFKNVKLKYDEKISIKSIPKDVDVIRIDANPYYCLSETFKWFIYKHQKETVIKPGAIPKFKIQRTENKKIKYIKKVAFALTVILIFPILINSAGWGMLYFFYKQHFLKQEDGGTNMVLIAKTFFEVSKNYGSVFKYVPVIGKVYKESVFASETGVIASEMALSGRSLVNDGVVLFNNILGDEIYDSTKSGNNIKLNLDYLYRNLSLMHSHVQEGVGSNLMLPKLLSQKIDFEKYKNMLLQGSILTEKLPDILGNSQKKKYLILFQNNTELRPTGGFIGSYGVLAMDGGRLSELNVNDVYSADGQLKGHVEPPSPLKEYLGEENWWLRDSNWDPDFPTSAQRAEWFLNKETDQRVDGVIALDLNIVKDFLSYTGPIFLPDFNLEISDKNLYEVTQKEVQDNFFPGTHKKASFLTALSRQLLFELEKTESKNQANLIKSVLSNFDGRHIQAYLHDNEAENSILMLGWGGAINTLSCGQGCYQDFVGLVEANLGFNKSNYFIARDIDMTVNASKDAIERSLIVNYHNSASAALGPSGLYGVYLRLILPNDAEMVQVSKIYGEVEEDISPEITMVKNRKEAGVWLKVLPQQNLRVKFSWKSDTSQGLEYSSYGIYVRKQAGVTDGPWNINLGFNLTDRQNYKYNTVLSRDFFQKIPLK